MRILIVTDSLPYPPFSGDRIRVYSLVKRIARKHRVLMATFVESPEQVAGVRYLKEFCERVEVVEMRRHRQLTHLPGLIGCALVGKPFEHKFYYYEELAKKIRDLVSTLDVSIVQFEKEWMAQYLNVLPRSATCKTVFMSHNYTAAQYDSICRIEQRLVPRIRAWIYSRMERSWERRFLRRFDRCLTVSELDRSEYLRVDPLLRIDVVPNGVDTRVYQPLPFDSISPTLLFVGNLGYPPSADAALYFCNEILPRVRSLVDGVEVWIVGRNPIPELLRLDGESIHVTGQVADVTPYYRRSSVCVVPLRAGGGTRLKILESMALGRPVVSTTMGCEGLDVVGGEHLLVGDDPERFAEQTVRLLKDRTLYQRITANARKLVMAHYDWDAIAARLMRVYDELVSESGDASGT